MPPLPNLPPPLVSSITGASFLHHGPLFASLLLRLLQTHHRDIIDGLDKVGPDDVGLGDELCFFHDMNTTGRQSTPIITYKTIFQCNKFEIAVIFLPPGTTMPLHDHPGMTVFTKLLTGSAHIRVFSGPGSSILAEKVLDHDITKDSGAWVLFPDTGGNVHRFVAGEETYCAFLNVLTPSSSPPANQRRCSTFYKDIPYKPCRCKHSIHHET
ncbi:hypothetical protein HU200_044265 [Digitaria exilis]|uniref:cysteine dioxygenase n=1 Tax=Digitaria exilis TaxID=1010633 RepID=A0A835B9K3_9POAL|nr:hypothetical protein HU200_044265 [Digitaria exilis]